LPKSVSHDYEVYAKLSPNFFADDAFPKPIVAALEGARGTFLDVGTGDGSKLRALYHAGLLAGFSRILATDFSQIRVERVGRVVPGVEAFVGDAENIGLPEGSVDFYYSDQVIEHVPNDTNMARDAFRLLSAGGRAFIGSVLKSRFAWYYYRSNGRWTIDPTHLREYNSEREYGSLFEKAGFKVERIVREPLVVPISDQIVRLMVRFKLAKADSLSDLYKSARFRMLRKLRIRIPGYFLIYAVLSKSSEKKGKGAAPEDETKGAF